ncbi:hypothetical protein COLO4_05948 [Corchorus olitorius]|uniref:Serine-threonine protein kinase, plant-type n=1 Tax=Corchorus olitorius TaxID=93759 RepID=A0A1R3KPK5_9ROSI|nr:hypothetical protein COLO4_05948 [Corchorus olitorius]
MTVCLSHKYNIGKAELLTATGYIIYNKTVRRRFEPNSGLWPGVVICLSPAPLETTAKTTWKEVSPYPARPLPFFPISTVPWSTATTIFEMEIVQMDPLGVYCAPPPYDNNIKVVAGIDLNGADIAGFLPEELGLLSDLALIHLNSNRFCGILPQSLANLSLLYELDLSNNRFVGPFPYVVLSLPSLTYLDIRYNEFEGPLPPQLFGKTLDAIFVNNNRFSNVIPSNFVGSSASVVVFANNKLGGCLPPSISNFANTLEELLLTNTSLSGCLPPEVGYLYKLKVLDVSNNNLVGPIPYSLAGLAHLEQLNLAHNKLTGIIPMGVCILPNLANFTFSYNFFCEEEGICHNLTSNGIAFDDRRNCLLEKPNQRSKKECEGVLEHPVDCFHYHCGGGSTAIPPAMMPAATTPLSSPSMAPGYV